MLEAPLFLLTGSILCILIFAIKYRDSFNFKAFFYMTFSIYILAVIILVTFPLPVKPRFISYLSSYRLVFVPFSDIRLWLAKSPLAAIRPIAKRILLFLPMGFYLPLLSPRANTLAKALKIGVLVALAAESLKLVISAFLGIIYKAISIDNVILFLIGYLFGTLIFFALRPWLNKSIRISDYTFTVRGN